MSLNPIGNNIWEVTTSHIMLGAEFPLRMLVMRGPDGSVTLVSPISLSDELAAAIDAVGPVRAIVAPNLFHHTYLAAASQRYPDAAVWGPVGLEKKRPDVAFTHQVAVTDQTVHAPADGVELLAVGGVPGLGELSVFHQPSRTMYLADMIMNIQQEAGLYTRTLFKLEGVWRRPSVPRLMRLMTRDKQALLATASVWADRWAPERIAPGHGSLVEPAIDVLAREFAG